MDHLFKYLSGTKKRTLCVCYDSVINLDDISMEKRDRVSLPEEVWKQLT